MSEKMSVFDFPEIRWKGHWIWVPEDKIEMGMGMPGSEPGPRQESHGLFRKSFTLDAVPAHVPARITADSRYALYVNGQEVSRGPVRSQPRRMIYDMVDLAPVLKTGENVIAIYVKFYGRPNSFYIPAVPNSGLGKTGALVFEADLGPAGWLVSDASWKATKSNAWGVHDQTGLDMIGGGVPVEQLDARNLPVGWKGVGFDDSVWPCAQVLRAIHIGGFAHSQPPTDPYGPLYPRPIAQLGGEVVAPVGAKAEPLQDAVDTSITLPAARVVSTMNLPAGPANAVTFPFQVEFGSGGARLVVDFGRIVAGLVQLEVCAPAGTTFDLCYVEDPLTGKEQGFNAPHNGSCYIARGMDDFFEAFDTNGLRYIYLVIHGTGGPVTINHLAVREMIYPWTPGASFECSDPELNRLYTAGIRTVNLNSFDAFTDCPTREQRAWVGDSVVHQMVHLAT
ncbi:MAG: alpha-L-rhamnosidase N-terminal domain-containing protein, partial [Anaerolineae bacterium]|nr:alpha-L-rhamnosidase N-terminal domain-containing protein [Anaerolineae bacterium]